MIMFEKMIERAESVEQKRFLLADKLSTSFGAVMRQNYIVLFEIETHKKLQEGATEKEISDAWLKTLQDQVGESVDIDNMFRYGWARYPHIHNTPFYCYAYNFGELLSLALYKRYKDEGESFIAKFEQILAVGGSQSPEKVLADVGIDINSEQFWQDSFKIIEDWQDQLEQL
jgi:oligoendopeptidase F